MISDFSALFDADFDGVAVVDASVEAGDGGFVGGLEEGRELPWGQTEIFF